MSKGAGIDSNTNSAVPSQRGNRSNHEANSVRCSVKEYLFSLAKLQQAGDTIIDRLKSNDGSGPSSGIGAKLENCSSNSESVSAAEHQDGRLSVCKQCQLLRATGSRKDGSSSQEKVQYAGSETSPANMGRTTRTNSSTCSGGFLDKLDDACISNMTPGDTSGAVAGHSEAPCSCSSNPAANAGPAAAEHSEGAVSVSAEHMLGSPLCGRLWLAIQHDKTPSADLLKEFTLVHHKIFGPKLSSARRDPSNRTEDLVCVHARDECTNTPQMLNSTTCLQPTCTGVDSNFLPTAVAQSDCSSESDLAARNHTVGDREKSHTQETLSAGSASLEYSPSGELTPLKTESTAAVSTVTTTVAPVSTPVSVASDVGSRMEARRCDLETLQAGTVTEIGQCKHTNTCPTGACKKSVFEFCRSGAPTDTSVGVCSDIGLITRPFGSVRNGTCSRQGGTDPTGWAEQRHVPTNKDLDLVINFLSVTHDPSTSDIDGSSHFNRTVGHHGRTVDPSLQHAWKHEHAVRGPSEMAPSEMAPSEMAPTENQAKGQLRGQALNWSNLTTSGRGKCAHAPTSQGPTGYYHDQASFTGPGGIICGQNRMQYGSQNTIQSGPDGHGLSHSTGNRGNVRPGYCNGSDGNIPRSYRHIAADCNDLARLYRERPALHPGTCMVKEPVTRHHSDTAAYMDTQKTKVPLRSSHSNQLDRVDRLSSGWGHADPSPQNGPFPISDRLVSGLPGTASSPSLSHQGPLGDAMPVWATGQCPSYLTLPRECYGERDVKGSGTRQEGAGPSEMDTHWPGIRQIWDGGANSGPCSDEDQDRPWAPPSNVGPRDTRTAQQGFHCGVMPPCKPT